METEEGTAFEFLPRRSPKDSSDLRLTADQASAFLRPFAVAIARGVSPRINPLRSFSPRVIPMAGGPPEMIFAMPELSSSMCARPPSNVCLVAEPTDDHKEAVFTYFDPVKGRGRELTRLDLSAGSETIRMGVSNDGTKLAFAPGPEGPVQIRRLGGGLERVIRTKGLGKLDSFGWAADGKGLFVIRSLVNAVAQAVRVNYLRRTQGSTQEYAAGYPRCRRAAGDSPFSGGRIVQLCAGEKVMGEVLATSDEYLTIRKQRGSMGSAGCI